MKTPTFNTPKSIYALLDMGGSVVVSQSDETFSRHEAPKSGREVVGTVGHSKKDRGIKTVKT